MSDDQEANEERPCLHCLFVALIDDFFAEYPAATGEPDTIDTDEVIAAVAKTVAELTSQPRWCGPPEYDRAADAGNYEL